MSRIATRRFARRPSFGPRRKAVQHEKIEQQHGELLATPYALKIYRFGTRRAVRCAHCGEVSKDLGTRQTPGPGDVLFFLRAPTHRDAQGFREGPRAVWWEAKRPKIGTRPAGKPSDEQIEFAELCGLVCHDHVSGDTNALVAYLIHGGWVRRDQIAHYRLPPESITSGA
jgi:hypothetical protein